MPCDNGLDGQAFTQQACRLAETAVSRLLGEIEPHLIYWRVLALARPFAQPALYEYNFQALL